MKEKNLWLSWLGLYIVCGGLGFIPEPSGLGKALMVLLSLVFFLPPVLLASRNEEKTLRRLRLTAFIWLAAALVLLVCNFLSVTLSDEWGIVLNGMLIIVTSPMVCSQYWAVCLFLMACLMIYAHKRLKSK